MTRGGFRVRPPATKCPIHSTSVISRSSPTSTTARRRCRTGCCRRPARSKCGRCTSRCSTTWIARAVTLRYTHTDGIEYIFNLIDTPGHVDFSYEVSRSLAACEGAVLVVDATQGVEAQTLANSYLAIANNLDILSVINKVDLPSAEPERVREQIENVIGLDAHDAVLASAKSGIGVDEILEMIVTKISAPRGDAEGPLRALLFDSWYDSYRGVMLFVRIVDGEVRKGMKIKFLSTDRIYEVTEVGVFTPKIRLVERLGGG